MESTLFLGLTDKADILALNLAILLSVLFGPLEDVGALLLASGTLVQGSLLALSTLRRPLKSPSLLYLKAKRQQPRLPFTKPVWDSKNGS